MTGASGDLVAYGTDTAPGSDGYAIGGECVEFCISGECWFPKVQLWACGSTDKTHGGSGNQRWKRNAVKGGEQLVNVGKSGQCLTALKAEGWAVGLDAGVTVTAAQLHPCYPAGTPNQTFVIESSPTDGDGEASFTVRSAMHGTCMQPSLEKLPHFDAVAFEQLDGSVSVVVMNTNDEERPMTIYDEEAGLAVEHFIPAHAITTYRYAPPKAKAAHAKATAVVEATTAATDPAATAQVAAVAMPATKAAPAGGDGGAALLAGAVGCLAVIVAVVSFIVVRAKASSSSGAWLGLAPARVALSDADDEGEEAAEYESFVEPVKA